MNWNETMTLDLPWTAARYAGSFTAQDRGPCALPQPAALGATGHAGAGRGVPVRIQGRHAFQLCSGIAKGSAAIPGAELGFPWAC